MKWQILEDERRENELTNKGYEKKRRELFLQEGLKVDEVKELENSKENHERRVTGYLGGRISPDDYRLFSRSECIQVSFFAIFLLSFKKIEQFFSLLHICFCK